MATVKIWCGTQCHRYQYFGRTCCPWCHSTLFTSQKTVLWKLLL